VRSRVVGRELAALAAPTALAGLGIVVGRFAADRAAAPWSAALALLAAGILALLTFAGAGSRAPLALIALALAPASFLIAPEDPLRLATWSGLLVAAVVLVAAGVPPEEGFGARRWVALALASQAVVQAGRLLVAPASARVLATAIALPLAAGLLVAGLERVDSAGARIAALTSFAAGPGWVAPGVVGLALGGALALSPRSRRFAVPVAAIAAGASAAWSGEPRWIALSLGGVAAAALLGWPRPARAARALLGAAALAALVAGGLPWRRPAPVAAVLRGAGRLTDVRIDEPIVGWARSLAASRPRLELPLAGGPIRRVFVDSFLIEGAALPCSTVVGRIELWRGGEHLGEAEVRVGEGVTEWAAERDDLRGRIACPQTVAPTAWLPSSGRFLARRDRARLELPAPVRPDRIVFERDSSLPESAAWVLVGAATER
jgi:hypothetical protein